MQLRLPVSNEPTLVGAVQKAVQSLDGSKPRSFDSYNLENSRGELVTVTASLTENETLHFYSPGIIIPAASSSWTSPDA